MTLSIYEIVAYGWAGMNIGIVLGFFMGITFFVIIYKNFMENTESMSATSRLKNALLSYALLKVKKDDFVGLDSGVSFVDLTTPIINYKTYDGDKLPRLHGFSIVNALMSYIVKPNKSFFYYTDHMNDKYNAIEKYIQKHLATDAQVIDFFQTFYEFEGEVKSKMEPIRETQETKESKEFVDEAESKTEPRRETQETKTQEFVYVSNKDVGDENINENTTQ